MEKGITTQRYSDIEREELIEQWKESGKSKAAFCKASSISYYSFNDWIRRRNEKGKKVKPSFVPLEIKTTSESNFATLILKNGITVNLHQRVDSIYLIALLKA